MEEERDIFAFTGRRVKELKCVYKGKCLIYPISNNELFSATPYPAFTIDITFAKCLLMMNTENIDLLFIHHLKFYFHFYSPYFNQKTFLITYDFITLQIGYFHFKKNICYTQSSSSYSFAFIAYESHFILYLWMEF